MKQNIVKEKSFEFSLLIIDVYKTMVSQKEYVISKQLLRSGTSIGANINEGIAGFSKKDFVYKMSIASKEARESFYWLELIEKSKLVNVSLKEVKNKCEELVKILTSIVKSSQAK